MDLEQIDMSLGLAVALPALKYYRMSGRLQAEVKLPGGPGRCLCCMYLSDGDVVSCAIRGERGQERNISLEVIALADHRKGPFAWSFVSQREPLQQQAPLQPLLSPVFIAPPSTVQNDAIPYRLKHALDLTWLNSISEEDKRVASWVFGLIDGQRSVATIKALLRRLPEQMIERVLVFLVATSFIDMH